MAAKTNICFFPTAMFTQDFSVLGEVETKCLLTHLGYSLTEAWHLLPCAARGRRSKKWTLKLPQPLKRAITNHAYRQAQGNTVNGQREPSEKGNKSVEKSTTNVEYRKGGRQTQLSPKN